MEKVIGEVHISYSVECPSCDETSYSDVHHEDWEDLEYGDGYPHGVLKCDNCDHEFYINIG